jgi:hypothetical protein
MNYKNIYDKIIENAKHRGLVKKKLSFYTELHHIIPACKFENRKVATYKENLVLLTAKEHFVCHHLLSKLNDSEFIKAFWMISRFSRTCIKLTHKEYEIIMHQKSEQMKNRIISDNTRNLISKSRLGSIASEETRLKISIGLKGKNKGRIHSDEFKLKIKEARKNQVMKSHSKETKEKMSAAAKQRIINNPNTSPSMLGHVHSEESKLKMSNAKRNTIPWNKGIKQSDYKKVGI